jgi:oligopeptidase B
MTTPPAAPRAERRPVTRVFHDTSITDDYGWLRADNWQEVIRDPGLLPADIRAYLEAENAHTAAAMADTETLQAALIKEMRGRIKEDDSSVPAKDGPYAYSTRYRTGGEHPLFMRALRDGGDELTILDGDALAEGTSYFQFGDMEQSPDHRLVAWSADDKGSEYYTIRIRDVATGQELLDEVGSTTGDIVWAEDSETFFYVWVNDNHRPSKVFRHRLGTPASEDILVYEEPDAGFFLGIGKTLSRAFVLIESHDHETSECRLLPANEPSAEPRLVAERRTAELYSVDDDGAGTLYILTNADDAEDFKIVTAPAESPGRDSWRDLVAHKPGRLILAADVFKGRLVRLEREDGLPRIVITDLASGAEAPIAFDEEAYALGFSGGYEFATDTLRFTYSSPTTPSRVYDYDMATAERVLRKEQEVPSGHDPERYVTRRVMAPAKDGELVPVTLLYRKDTPLDGSAPTWLYGYGSYGIAIPAGFSSGILSLVDRGFIHAIAHVRGGKEKGFRWYKAGRREMKTNTFDDFLAAAHFLIAEGITSRGRIVASGGSAGGMLMGAVANMEGDLFGGIVAVVPFVDVLNTMLDDTLPLTPPEWPEWGNPIASPEAFATIRGYSPYDNVAAKAYPPILALGGLTDPRVTYWEPAKWVARLRELKTDDNPLLLKINMDAGHGGASGRFESLKETALEYAFALKVAGRV